MQEILKKMGVRGHALQQATRLCQMSHKKGICFGFKENTTTGLQEEDSRNCQRIVKEGRCPPDDPDDVPTLLSQLPSHCQNQENQSTTGIETSSLISFFHHHLNTKYFFKFLYDFFKYTIAIRIVKFKDIQ